MTALQAMLLGLVQGLTEFLPISSSGHLVLVEALLGVDTESTGVLFEVLVHAGTLGAILVVFWRDAWALVRGGLGILASPLAGPRGWLENEDQQLAFVVVLGTLPVVGMVLVAREPIEHAMKDPQLAPLLTGICLIVTGLLLLSTRWKHGEVETVSWRVALAIGLGQAVALLPGISRSGTTIALGLLLGLHRQQAARFSFLLAIPAILGATVLHARDLVHEPPPHDTLVAYTLGAVVAFVTGLGALLFLLRIVRVGRLSWFSPYCVFVGVVAIVASLATHGS